MHLLRSESSEEIFTLMVTCRENGELRNTALVEYDSLALVSVISYMSPVNLLSVYC